MATMSLTVKTRAQEPVSAPGSACDITANPMKFPAYDPSVPYDTSAVGTISVTCNSPLLLQISLITTDACTRRNLRFGLNRLVYNLYQDSGHSIVWGSLNPICGRVLTDTVILRSQFSVYGLLPREQNVVAGTYSDVVTIEANF
ncbi:MAG: spore coat U domain-containing protein [Candidatus Aquilonibacter sp.]